MYCTCFCYKSKIVKNKLISKNIKLKIYINIYTDTFYNKTSFAVQ